MNLSMDFWQFMGTLSAIITMFVSVMIASGKMLINQFEQRLDERFSTLEAGRIASAKHWDTRFLALEQAAVNEAKEWQRIEREILNLKADLPSQYVRRDDYIRNQTIIEAKIDGLAMRIENAILKGERSNA